MSKTNTEIKSTQNTDAKNTDAKKVEVRTLVTDIKAQLLTGVKSDDIKKLDAMAVLVKNVLAKRKELGLMKNIKGNVITEQGIRNLCNAFRRDIRNNKKGHWSTYEDKSTDKELKISVKAK